MALAPLDWIIVGAYVVFVLIVGLAYAKKAGKDVDQYFLSGRSLPWWIAGTSMVATSFAADTPLVITGWVREYGIWKNWLWWCYCGGGMMGVFLFARWWRRGGVMTKAELAELRYGGSGAAALRGTLGVMHAGVTNTITLCWVLLAAAKIMDVLLGIDQNLAVALACAVALAYSLMAGFWGVVMTDLVQFVMAMVGAVALAWLCWSAVGGSMGIAEAAAAGAPFTRDTLLMTPHAGQGSVFDASFWTVPFAALCVYLGVSWWAVENVDGASVAVQRIAASRTERQGVYAMLWYNIVHYAFRPWPWIMVALASMIVLPPITLTSPVAGIVTSAGEVVAGGRSIVIEEAGGERHEVLLPPDSEDWRPAPTVEQGDSVTAGATVARTDSERAYVVMMRRYLPVGLLGLVVASLLAAFMSTIDTHVNLAASFFVNDIYRRFLRREASAEHYVAVARIASACVLILAGLMASQANSISDLFLFFLAFLGGVGPVYVLRWLWWRVQASTEITAMFASAGATIFLTLSDVQWQAGSLFGAGQWIDWNIGPFSSGGKLVPEGRLCLVVLASISAALLSLAFTKRPDPRRLVGFYRAVRPVGAWGPVAALAPDVERPRDGFGALGGILGGVAMVYGLMLGLGFSLLGDAAHATPSYIVALVGTVVTVIVLRRQIKGERPLGGRAALAPEVESYVGDSYPHNIDYEVADGRLFPGRKLSQRFGPISRGYASPLVDLLDLSCSKGYFVLEAAGRPECRRALGIDVHEPDLLASRAVAAHLGLERADFRELTLTQLAERLPEFGGPFETVLLINTYPYLYFGSNRSDSHLPDHAQLFRLLSELGSRRVIFSNRIEFERCPRHIQARAHELGLAEGYTPEAIRAACERYFVIEEQAPLGKIPLWFLTRR